MVGLREVAKVAGVSARTVSRVMRGEQNVAADTRRRIRSIAKEMGYRPNLAARGLKSRRTQEVVLIAWASALFNDAAEMFMQRIEGFENRLREAGIPLKIRLEVPADPEPEEEQLQEIIDELVLQQPIGVASFLLAGPTLRVMAEAFRAADIPLVVMDMSSELEIKSPLLGSVRIDRAQGIADSVAYLHGSGRSHIAYAGVKTPNRLSGYLKAMESLGLAPDCHFLPTRHTSPDLFAQGRQLAAELAESKDRPEAIQAYSDALAMGLVDGFKAAGVAVPEDIAIVGFDDRVSARQCHPALTTVALPNREVGFVAAELLLAMMSSGKKLTDGWERIVPTKLVQRESA